MKMKKIILSGLIAGIFLLNQQLTSAIALSFYQIRNSGQGFAMILHNLNPETETPATLLPKLRALSKLKLDNVALIYGGESLDDHLKLSFYSIKDNDLLFIVPKDKQAGKDFKRIVAEFDTFKDHINQKLAICSDSTNLKENMRLRDLHLLQLEAKKRSRTELFKRATHNSFEYTADSPSKTIIPESSQLSEDPLPVLNTD